MSAALAIEIVPLDRVVHDRAAFSCGQERLDRYLREQAAQDVKKRVAAVFVAARPGKRDVLGYYTLAQASIALDDLPAATKKRLPKYPNVPVTLLGRLAVRRGSQGIGLGTWLLGDAARRAAQAAADVASAGIIVEPIDDAAAEFYQRFGFEAISDSPARMFLPMGTITKALATTP